MMTAAPAPPGLRLAYTQLRVRGFRWFVHASLQHLRARWALRGASTLGTVRLRGRARLVNDGSTIFGDRVRLDGTIVPLDLYCGPGAVLSVGDGTFVNYGSSIGALRSVSIGRDCDIGQYAIIMDSNQHLTEAHRLPAPAEPVVIEDGVWIGARVTVLPGAHIGRGAVIGAHAVVRGFVPPRTLAVGVPARVVRNLEGFDGDR